MIKAIIFDFDGVICDTQKIIFKLHNKHLEKISLEEIKEKVFSGNSSQYFQKFSEEKKKNFQKEFIKLSSNIVLKKKIRKNLLELNKNYNLFIISNSWKKALDDFFENNNFTNIFKKIYSKEYSFTKIERFKLLFKEFNLNKDEVIFITDTLGDILEANEMGIKTIAVTFGFHNEETLKKGNPWKIISEFDEIKKILKF